MAKQTIGLGTEANDGTGDTLRVAGDKINDNFDELYAVISPASASGPASVALAEDTDNGTNKITISPPASIASDRAVTLPDAAGEIIIATITSLAAKHSLEYNGSAWVNRLGGEYKTVWNATGSTITAGTLVTINGTAGAVPTVITADKDDHDAVAGIVVANISAGTAGVIESQGTIQESFINTNGMTSAALLYLGDAGAYTTTKPTSGNIVVVGIVGVAASSSGSIILNCPGVVEGPYSTTAALRTGTAVTGSPAPATIYAAGALVTVTYGATVALDFATFNCAKITLTGDLELTAPSNLVVGKMGVIQLIQDGTGGHELTAVNSAFQWAGGDPPVLSTAANAKDEIAYWISESGVVSCRFVGDVKT
jgi:hypothetical protein